MREPPLRRAHRRSNHVQPVFVVRERSLGPVAQHGDVDRHAPVDVREELAAAADLRRENFRHEQRR
jgi:hypothetical protein